MSQQTDPLPAPDVDERGVYPTCFEAGTWFAWKLTDEEPPRKIPRAPWNYPEHVDRYVGHNDPDAWTNFDTAQEWTSMLVGFGLANRVPDVEADEPRPVFFDFDDVRNPETEAIHPEAWEFIQTHDLPVWLSSSRTGIHAFALVDELPEEYKEQVVITLSDVDGWEYDDGDEPELEVYARRHFCALTGEHVEGTPIDSPNLTELVGRMIRERGEKKRTEAFDPERDPEKTREELADIETTTEIEDVFDAVRLTGPRDVRLRSSVTEERADGSKSLDPSWASSSSGTRLAQIEDGWVYRKGNVGLDALQVVALEERIIHSVNDYPSGEDFWEAVDALRQRGAHIPEYDADADAENGELVVTLPENPRPQTAFGALSAQTDADADAEDGTDNAPSINDVHERVTGALNDAMANEEQVVVDAIMGGGKTYSAFDVAYTRDEPLLYTAGRKDLYEQAEDYALEVGYNEDDIYVLPSPDECPTFNGEHGHQWEDRAWKLYRRGVHASTLHKLEDLPCCDDEPACPYEARNKFDPNDYDVIIGHYKHAHVPPISIGRHVIVDENPTAAFMTSLAGDALIEGVNAFLSLEDSPAVSGFDDLLAARHDDERRETALEWYQVGNGGQGFYFEPDERNAVRFEERGYHAYAPHAVYAILTGSPVGGSWDGHDGQRYPFERASFPGIGREARVYTTSDEFSRAGGDLYYVQIQTPPEIENARSIIALDGTPLIDDWSEVAEAAADGERVAEWEVALGRPLTRRRTLSDDERAAFLRETMGHTYIQTSKHVRPYSSAKYHDPERDEALLAAASEQYLGGGSWDVAITAKKVADEYRDLGFNDDERGLVETIDHWGNVRGSDEYGECRSGVILGSAHHGDHEIARRAAWLDEQVHPEGKGQDRSYGPAGDAVLEQMRELATAQTALRIGRGEDGRGAIVLLDTCAYPNWLPVVNPDSPADVSLWRESDRDVREAVVDIMQRDGRGDVGGVLTSEVLEEVEGHSKRTVHRALARHADRGLLERTDDPRDGRRTLWLDSGLTQQAEAATVSIPAVDHDTAEDFDDSARIEHYTPTVIKTDRGDTPHTPVADGGPAPQPPRSAEAESPAPPGGPGST